MGTWSPNGSPLKKMSAFPKKVIWSKHPEYSLDEHIRKPEILNDATKPLTKIYKFSSEAPQGVLFSTYLFLEEEKAKLRFTFSSSKKKFSTLNARHLAGEENFFLKKKRQA